MFLEFKFLLTTLYFMKLSVGRAQWLTPLILTLREAKVGRLFEARAIRARAKLPLYKKK